MLLNQFDKVSFFSVILPEVYFPFLFYLAFLNGAVSNIFNHVEPLIRFFTANRFLKLELYLYYKFTVSICLSLQRDVELVLGRCPVLLF